MKHLGAGLSGEIAERRRVVMQYVVSPSPWSNPGCCWKKESYSLLTPIVTRTVKNTEWGLTCGLFCPISWLGLYLGMYLDDVHITRMIINTSSEVVFIGGLLVWENAQHSGLMRSTVLLYICRRRPLDANQHATGGSWICLATQWVNWIIFKERHFDEGIFPTWLKGLLFSLC